MGRFPRIFHSERVAAPFQGVERIDVASFFTEEGVLDESKFRSCVEKHCIENGDPLVICNFQSLKQWDQGEFSLDRLETLTKNLEYEIYNVEKYEQMDRISFAEFLSRISYPQTRRSQKRGRRADFGDDNHVSRNKSQRTGLQLCIEPIRGPDDNQRNVPDSVPVVDVASSTSAMITKEENDGQKYINNEPVSAPPWSYNSGSYQDGSNGQLEFIDIFAPRLTRSQARMLRKPEPSIDIPKQSKTSNNDSDADRERRRMQIKNMPCKGEPLYCKDIICPDVYRRKLREMIPDFLLPLGYNDLFKNFPVENRPESQMCYTGGTGSGTALHRDICGTLGHNLMIFAEPNAYAEWIMIKNEHREKLLSTFHEPQNEDFDGLLDYQRKFNKKSSFIECDRAWISPLHLNKANIPSTVIIQQPGDLVIVPSLCYHQVRNFGVSTKVAWNRATLQSLELALEEQLPVYKSVNRPEVFRCKAMMYYTLTLWKQLLSDYVNAREINDQVRIEDTKELSIGTLGWDHFVDECRLLVHLFTKHALQPETIETIPFEGVSDSDIPTDTTETTPFTLTCNFCRCDIFHRFYRCEHCEDFDLCLDCYAQGRGCQHLTSLTLHQARKPFNDYQDLVESFINIVNQARGAQVLCLDPFTRHYNKSTYTYTLATICRRIELHRKKQGNNCNMITCGHCRQTKSLLEIYQQHSMGIQTIFGRILCIKASRLNNEQILYTCSSCSESCRQCLPTSIQRKDDSEKYLFWDAYNDKKNWGGVTDKGLLCTYYWPEHIKCDE